MQESRARLHGWRRRGRMAGGGRGGGGGGGGGLGSKRERKEGRGGLDEKQLPQDGGVWMGGFGEEGRRVGGGGPAPTLQFCRAQGQGCAGGLGEVRVP